MRIIESCEKCLLDKQTARVKDMDPQKAQLFINDVNNLLANRKENDSAPYMVYLFNKAFEKYFGKLKDFSDIKKEYNDLVLNMENEVVKCIESYEDPLEASMIFSRIGNYIDFGAMNHVDKDTFLSMFEIKEESKLDKKVYASFLEQCANGKNFVLLCDNCGEIVLDKLFFIKLKKRFPNLKCYAIVRGEEVLNDATLEDAIYCGLDKEVTVVSNGAGIAGTVFDMLSPEARKVIEEADVILSKGQGNYETAAECGKKIFYSFLCKCDLFVNRFNANKLDGMFVEEK